MNRSRSPTRRGPGRPKRSTRKEDPSSSDNEAHGSVNRSRRRSKKMRVISPATPSTSRASQRGKSSAQPRRHKNLTGTRRAVMNFFIQAAEESPRKNGQVGSLQWMEKVLEALNKDAEGDTDRVTNLDLMWWLEKHFHVIIKDGTSTGSSRTTRSQSRERAKSSEVEENDGTSGSRAESADEVSTEIEESEVENSEVGRTKRATERTPTPQRAAENLSKNVEPAQGGAENVPPEAVANVREEEVIAPEAVIAPDKVANGSEAAADSQEETEASPESAALAQGPSSSSGVKFTTANVEAPAANVQPATSAAEDEDAGHGSPSVALEAGSGTDGDGEAVAHRAGVELEEEDPAAVNPDVEKLKMRMVALSLQLIMLKKKQRYSVEQVEVLTALAKAMTGMINMLTPI